MKHIKMLKVPADTIVHELLHREPHFVSVDGVCLNLDKLAASLIESLTAKVSELENTNEEAARILETIAPDIYRMADLYDETMAARTEDYAAVEEDGSDEPEARIIATFLAVQEK